LKRRDFITLLGGMAVAWPLAHAQQRSNPVVGFLRPNKAEDVGHMVAALRQGLRESGYPPDKVIIESRWADDHQERLPKLASELVALPVTAIVAGSVPAARAAKAATASIPIVFVTGIDPVTEGLVSSLNRPLGNIIGVSFYDVPIIGKRIAVLRELVPNADLIAVLQDPNSAAYQTEARELESAVHAMGQKIITLKAGSEQEINAAFSTIAKSGASALSVGGGPFLMVGAAKSLVARPSTQFRFAASAHDRFWHFSEVSGCCSGCPL